MAGQSPWLIFEAHQQQLFIPAQMNNSAQNIRWLSGPRALCFAGTLALATLDGALAGSQSAPSTESEVAPAQAPAPETPPSPAAPVEVDPSITLKGSVWRTKTGIVFLKTPVGLLTLSSKTTLKDLKSSHEVSFWVHERHFVVEIRRRNDGSLVHRYLGGPMTPGPDSAKRIHQRHFEASIEEVIAGKRVMRQSLFTDEPLAPAAANLAGVAAAFHASPLVAYVLGGAALLVALVALAVALLK